VDFRKPLTWDILQGLALVDGIAGDGGDFWLVRPSYLLLLAPWACWLMLQSTCAPACPRGDGRARQLQTMMCTGRLGQVLPGGIVGPVGL
jgi:hypothetical protein